MAIPSTSAITSRALQQAYQQAVGPQGTAEDSSFGRLLADMVQGADAAGDHASEISRRMLAGEATDVHEIMIAQEEAGLAFTLMVEIRNKLVEAYDELMRVQV